MINKVYVIHDSAVKSFVSPHFCRTHGEAERNFKQAVNDPKTGHLHNSPDQFTLFYIGEYDDQTGLVTSLPAPQAVLSGAQAKQYSASELEAV